MKKFPLFCIVFVAANILYIGTTLAYTSVDLANTNYLADQGVVVRQTTTAQYRLDDRILRQEVIAMVLRIKGIKVPEDYKCKQYYSDVRNNDWVCSAIETAADSGIITRENTRARPLDVVTRSEALAMLLKTGKITLSPPRRVAQPDGSVWSLYQDLQGLGFTQWQADMMDSLPNCSIVNHGVSCEDGASTYFAFSRFQPNTPALRSEVFEYTALMLGFNGYDDIGFLLDDFDIFVNASSEQSQTLEANASNL